MSVDYVRSYEVCPVSATTALGAAGAKGDLIERLVCVVATSATSLVQIKDGTGTAIDVLPAVSPVGTTNIMLNMVSQAGAWSVITLGGATVIAIGKFT